VFVTVTIQTYNNAAVLRQTLESLAALACPDGVEYEVLVVDNNSDDETAAVIQQSQALFGSRLRSVFETKQGLSYARNRAIAEARGEIVCFVDDDALADSRWLIGHVRAYRHHPQAVAVGGRVLLQWPDGWTRPSWLSSELDGYLSGVDLGTEGQIMHYPRYPFGCNMSVRRELAEKIQGFSVKLGRKKSSLVSNEEKHFFYRIHELGGEVVYTPDALVHHMVPATRLSRKFFLKRGFAQGVSNVLFQTETNPGNGVLRWYVRQMAVGMRLLGEATVNAAGCCLSRHNQATRFSRAVRMTYCLGYLAEAAKGAGRKLWSRRQ